MAQTKTQHAWRLFELPSMKKWWKGLIKNKWVKVSLALLSAVLIVTFIRWSIQISSILFEWALVLAVFAALIYLVRKGYQKITGKELNAKVEQAKGCILTFKEQQVLYGISQGLTNKQIGESLFISESAVKKHVSNIFVKLNAKRRTEAVHIARESALID
ncbi:MAG: response regulator transcription factor [Balneolaceae bacterium]|nr:response regulator transcription factor [Balneolaceae bacterium]